MTFALNLCLFALIQTGVAAPTNGSCVFPPGLGKEISGKYPGTHLVTLADLDKDDRKFYLKQHGTRCPGLIKVDFYGDGKPTWALALMRGRGMEQKTQLVVAREIDNSWQLMWLDSTDGPAPVVWREGPGEYRDVYGEKTIRATHSVIVFAGYFSWEIVYSWTGKAVEKVWLAD